MVASERRRDGKGTRHQTHHHTFGVRRGNHDPFRVRGRPLLTYRVKGGYSGQTNPGGVPPRGRVPVLILPVVAGAHEWIAGARTWNHLAAVDGDLILGVPPFCVVNTRTRTLKR